MKIRYLADQGGLSGHELADALGYFEGTGIKIEMSAMRRAARPHSSRWLPAMSSWAVLRLSAVLNSIAGGNDFVAAYPSNGINQKTESIFYSLEGKPDQVDQGSCRQDDCREYARRPSRLHGARSAAFRRPAGNAAKLVVVPGPQLEQVLRSKQVDVTAFGYWQKTFEGAALKNGGLQKIFGDTDVLGEIAGGFVVLRRDWIKAHPKAAQVFVEQSQRALDYAQNHPEETKKIIARVLTARGGNGEIAQYFTGYGLRHGAKATDRDIQFWIDILVRGGQIKKDQIKVENVLYTPERFRQQLTLTERQKSVPAVPLLSEV